MTSGAAGFDQRSDLVAQDGEDVALLLSRDRGSKWSAGRTAARFRADREGAVLVSVCRVVIGGRGHRAVIDRDANAVVAENADSFIAHGRRNVNHEQMPSMFRIADMLGHADRQFGQRMLVTV